MSSPHYCIVVPLYNHAAALKGTIDRLLPFGIPILIVDDGSTDGSSDIARELSVALPCVDLVMLPMNRGKGFAVMAGMREANARGYTHVVQVDADGQHDIDKLGELLELSGRNPSALVSGRPQFDHNAPLARRMGRWATHVWVWIETLSTSIPDSMCGFRIYPLQACMELIDSVSLGHRMDFDIEIAVRLHWRGVPFLPLDVKVDYPDGGVSHFSPWRDNLLISWLHTRLFFGMLLRFPAIVWRRLAPRSLHWSRVQERGTVLGMRVLFWSYRFFGRAIFSAVLYVVIAYFYVTGRQARQASKAYLERVRKTASRRGRTLSEGLGPFRHMYCFGQSALDKVAVWTGSIPEGTVRFADSDYAAGVRDAGRGGVFIGSHLGNLEMCRALAHNVDALPITTLVFSRHAEKFNRIIGEVNPEAVTNLLQVDTLTPAALMRLQDRVEAGEFVAIVGDRTAVGNESRSITAEFLGEPAAFPEGAFIVASLLRCPVYLLFCLKDNSGYTVHLEPFANPLVLDRGNRSECLRGVVEAYAARLEHYCLEAPLQWFNFFDFWAPVAQREGRHS